MIISRGLQGEIAAASAGNNAAASHHSQHTVQLYASASYEIGFDQQ